MTTKTTNPLPVPQEKDSSCPHWWEIPEANGPVSTGKCKICGDTREFKNSFHGKHRK